MVAKSSKNIGIIRIDIAAQNALTGGLFQRIPKEGKIMLKSTLKILPALMVAITAAWVTQPAFGDGSGFHDFVITENSSASLTATYDGSPLTVNLTSPDHWNFVTPRRIC